MDKGKFSFYKEFPKTCSPDDFWGQVKRTVNGKPVPQEQIDMIVDAVVSCLQLNSGDTLLDLCCGNGALSSLFFKHCDVGVGVDFSEYLISIANEHFADPPAQTYILRDVVEFCANPIVPNGGFTKAVCYGSFAYLPQSSAESLLRMLYSQFPRLERVFIGNCPDKSLLSDFFNNHEYVPGIEDDPDSPIGVWRTQEEFSSLASRFGWKIIAFHKMPEEYYASHYRYDVILSR